MTINRVNRVILVDFLEIAFLSESTRHARFTRFTRRAHASANTERTAMTKPTRDVTLGFDDIIAHSQRGAMFIDHDGAVVVQIFGVDELVEVDADTAVRFMGPKKAQQLIQAIAESLDSEDNEEDR